LQPARRPRNAFVKPRHAYTRFLAGQDIAQLSRFYRVRESTVQRWIDDGRRKGEERA
jgi:transposase-like protein